MTRARLAVRRYWGVALAGAAILFVYRTILLDLVREWDLDQNYSHGYLVIPAALYLAWLRRGDLARQPLAPSVAGALIVGASLLVLLAGTAGIEYFLTRVSFVGVIAGAVIFLLGWGHFRVLAFPIAFLLLMIPLPAILFNQVAFPLQLLASHVGVQALNLIDVPVLREGNVIVLPAVTLEVAEACSGIRSLVSLVTVASFYAVLTQSGTLARTAITLSAVPAALFANALRVAGTGIAAYYYGASAATGFLHGFSSWFVFVVAFLLVVGVERLVTLARSAAVSRPGWEVRHP